MSNKAKLVLALLALIALLAAVKFLNLQHYLQIALDWIEGLGPSAAIIFILIYIVATVFLIPGSILTLGAGAVFGVVTGSVYVSIASILGATAAFLTGRYLAREWVSNMIRGNKKFAAIDDAVGREGWKIVGLTRLSPVFPFALLNYAYGLTKVSLRDYFFASWIGMLPGTVMYVYLGSAAKAGLQAASGRMGRTPAEWALFSIGLIATVAVTVFVTAIAKRALREKV